MTHIYPTQFTNTYDETIAFGVRIVGDTNQVYVDTWTEIPSSDEAILERVVRTVQIPPWPTMLAAIIANQSGIYINGVYFDYGQISHI